MIGPLRIGIPLFNIYLNEADELSRRLVTELAEWSLEHDRHPVPETSVALAHSLAGSSATVGYADLSALARALEHALMRSHAAGRGRADEPRAVQRGGRRDPPPAAPVRRRLPAAGRRRVCWSAWPSTSACRLAAAPPARGGRRPAAP